MSATMNGEWEVKVVYKPIVHRDCDGPYQTEPAYAVALSNEHCFLVDQFRYAIYDDAHKRMTYLLAQLNGNAA